MEVNSKMQNSLIDLESDRNNYDFKYSIENLTGEEIFVATHETDEFISVYANQVMMLDFSHKYENLSKNTLIKQSSIHNSTFYLRNHIENTQNIRSPYRKENFRIQSSLEGRTKKVYLFIPNLTAEGSTFYEESEQYFYFEIKYF